MPRTALSIFPLTEVRNLRFQCSVPELHVHPFHQIFVLTKGGGTQTMHGETVEFKAPWVLMIPQGLAHLYLPSADSEGWSIGFTDEYLPPGSTLLVSSVFPAGGVPVTRPGTAERLCGLARILQEGETDPGGTSATVQFHVLAAFLELLHHVCQFQQPADRSLPLVDHLLFQRFTRLLDEAFRSRWDVGRFARELRCSQRKLSTLCQRIMGKSPHAALEERRMIEARRMLTQDGGSVQQIALDLGYEDPSYFAKAFRRVVGETPTDYRNQRLGLNPAGRAPQWAGNHPPATQ